MKERMALFRRISVLIAIAMIILSALAITASAQDEGGDSGEEEAIMFGLGLLALLAVCLVISILIAVLCAVWIYKDAEKRGKSGALWAVIMLVAAFLAGIIGIIIVAVVWVMVRPPEMPPGVMYGPPPQQPYYPPQQPGYPPQQPPQYPPQQPPGGY